MERSNSTPVTTEQRTESGTASKYTDVWSEFKCVFCGQDSKHMTEPKLMSCLHTACSPCLASEANSESSPSCCYEILTFNDLRGSEIENRSCERPIGSFNAVKQILCQSCTQEINIVDAIDHLFLNEYAETSENLPKEISYPCVCCEEGNEGIGFCQECLEWLCESCVNAHHRVRVTKDHVVRTKEEMDGKNTAALHNQRYLPCLVHPNEMLKVYCETCDKLTCRDCQLTDHKAHKYQFLIKACAEQKKHMTEFLFKIKEKQAHMEEASNSLNKGQEEIVKRESKLSAEIRKFFVDFIADINKRTRTLFQDLNKICTDKKRLLNVKSQELNILSQRLKHCQKFAEAAVSLGSETALVYSKKPIINQLQKILSHKCDVPDPHHFADIQFNYEANYFTQYISSLGQILVDSQLLPSSLANSNAMLPMPQTISQNPVPNNAPIRQVLQMHVNQRATLPTPVQQMNHQQQQVKLYGQPELAYSTDMVGNPMNPQMRQMMNNQMNYGRANHVQCGPVPNWQGNFEMQSDATYAPGQMVQQQNPQAPMRQRAQIQPPQQQQQQIQQTPPPYNNSQLPIPLRTNENPSFTTLPSPSGPTPSKQREPRSNMTINAMNSQANIQRMNTNQVSQVHQNRPQLIVLNRQNKKISNTSKNKRWIRLPCNLLTMLATNPSLQIQPATNNNFSSPPICGQQVSLEQFGDTSVPSTPNQSCPNLYRHLIKPSPNLPDPSLVNNAST